MAGRIVSSFNSYNTILYHLKNWSKSSSTWQCHCDSCECHGDNVMSLSCVKSNPLTPGHKQEGEMDEEEQDDEYNDNL